MSSCCGDTIFVDDDSEEAVEIVQEKEKDIENEFEQNEFCIEQMESKLANAIVDSQEKAHKLYCDFAHACGFSVRKGKQYYVQGTNKIRSKVFCCSKQGVKKNENGTGCSNEKLETRTACKAMILFEINSDGLWKVAKLQNDHNHEMAKEYERHMLRSARQVTKAQGDTLESLVSSGIKTSQAFSYLIKESGGVGSVGFLKKDAYNELNNRRNSIIEKGDAQSLVNHFKEKSNKEGLFFWNVELDDEGRIHNFFWRDGRSQIDYDFFGDVVVFDATYRTNKYNLICAPFIGVNHHWQTVIFACAFLSDETTTSFEWAFKSFLESMDNKQPITFMTDQDYAIMKATSTVFLNSKHRLCLWHIAKNAPSYLGSLNSDRGFQGLFHKCLNGCETKEEFEVTWRKMISDYSLEGHKWLERLYNLRDKWCTAFSNDIFSADLITTSRSESINNVLNGIGSKTTSLTKFVLEFERKLGEWRQNEAAADFLCKQGKPSLLVKHSSFLQQGASFYTHKIYKLFEKECMDIIALSHVEEKCGEMAYRFHVSMTSKWGLKTSIVDLDMQECEVQCSCRKFESMGILCTHALAVLKFKNVDKILEKYLLKRWGKDAKKRVTDEDQQKIFQMDGTNSDIMFTNRAMKFAYELVSRSQSHEQSRLIFWQGLESIGVKIDEYSKKHSLIDAHSGVRDSSLNMDDSNTLVRDPFKIRTKGREKRGRLKGHFERNKKSTSSQGKRKKALEGACLSLDDSNTAPTSVSMPPIDITCPLPTLVPGTAWNSQPFGGYFPSFTSMLQDCHAQMNSAVDSFTNATEVEDENEDEEC